MEPTCTKSRLINFFIDKEREDHLDHVIYHIKDVGDHYLKKDEDLSSTSKEFI